MMMKALQQAWPMPQEVTGHILQEDSEFGQGLKMVGWSTIPMEAP